MSWEKEICGQHNQINFLKNALKSSSLAHAYIFAGAESLGKRFIAKSLALELLCETQSACKHCQQCRLVLASAHPDLSLIAPSEKTIVIEQIRSLKEKLAQSSAWGSYKMVIIDDAHTMNHNSANSLLKTLEEPKGKTILFLITNQEEKLLKTILSRSQIIRFQNNSNQQMREFFDHYQEKPNFEVALALAGGRPGVVINYFENSDFQEEITEQIQTIESLWSIPLDQHFALAERLGKDHSQCVKFLKLFSQVLRDMLLLSLNIKTPVCSSKVHALSKSVSIEKTKKLLEQVDEILTGLGRNYNTKLMLSNLFLNLR